MGLNKVPRGVVDVMLRPGQPFSGDSLMAAAPGAAWESMRSMLTDLLVSGLIVLASPRRRVGTKREDRAVPSLFVRVTSRR